MARLSMSVDFVVYNECYVAVQMIKKSPVQLEVHDRAHKCTILSNFNPVHSIIAYPFMNHFDIIPLAEINFLRFLTQNLYSFLIF